VSDIYTASKFLIACSILVWDSENVRPGLADMLKPSMQTLKNIVLTIHVDDEDVDPLFGIPSDFEVMRTRNIIETVTIKIVVEAATDIGCRRDEWGRLDKVLTAPGWFSLKRVSLTIEITCFLAREDEPYVALRKLHEMQFPRLSSSNSVTFDFDVIPTGMFN
jgi:hypothetical protein